MTIQKTLAYAKSRVGDNEYPPRSNRGWFWTHVSQHWGVNLSGQPWCGAFLIDCAYHGGLKLPWRFVSVYYIVGWGKARLRYRRGGGTGIRPGDAIILFGSKHVELAATSGTTSGVWCYGGNTGGSEPWAGGTVAKTFRRNYEITGYVKLRDKYPVAPKFVALAYPLKKVPINYFGKKLKFAASVRPRIHNGHLNATDKKNVARLQTWLKYLGFYKGTVDGFVGDRTHAAIVAFQKSRKYKSVGGAVGPGMWLDVQKRVYAKRYL
jgi:hypothetical protein